VSNAWLSPALPYLAGACILLVVLAALHDLAARTVPNRLALLVAILGLLARAIQGNLVIGVAAAAAVFALAALCWSRGWMGGGDVKLLGASALAVPPVLVPTLVIVMAIAGGILSLFYLTARRLVPAPSLTRPRSFPARVLRAETWRIRRGGPLPYACAIAAGGVFVLL
jgi:prepilin peptidase CpaA